MCKIFLYDYSTQNLHRSNLRPRPRRHRDACVDHAARARVEDVVDGLELRRAQVLGRQEQVLGPQRQRRRRGEERREELVDVARRFWR